MAQTQPDATARAMAPATDSNAKVQQPSMWRNFFLGREKDHGASGVSDGTLKEESVEQHQDPKPGLIRRVSRKVVPGLPRAGTFKRQQSELRSRLEPVCPTPAERRAVSVDRRMHTSSSAFTLSNPRTSAPDFLHHAFSAAPSPPSLPTSPIDGIFDSAGDLDRFDFDVDPDDRMLVRDAGVVSRADVQSMTTSQYDAMIDDELERIWILNLSMHFRDKSKREKFFVTYREHEHLWRRVTISLDYRNALDNSLEMDLACTKFQREKNAKIYEAIRESLPDIQFYDTVTNLKLETKEGRLHVHVVEDVNEIISYPSIRMIQHMSCRRVKEREIHFDSHMSGFVYKVRVHGRVLIKKEIPGPDTVEEFLYEINALNALHPARNVIQFYGVVVDDSGEHVTGLLISYAERGALIDVIYDHNHSLPWPARERWARQIVAGLSEIHEAGFVQGDFTLSNIVIDENEDAKIIDINRRGCPIGWEPPEATPLIESNQRISMYIGVKSDLYQLGMVLWALATEEDEPEAYGRPLKIEPDVQVPAWYRRIVETCLSANPRDRINASQLLSWFPDPEEESQYGRPNGSSVAMTDEGGSRRDFNPDAFVNGIPRIKTVHPPSDWTYAGWNGHTHMSSVMPDDSYYYPARGRSPPSPMPSNQGDYESSRYGRRMYTWSDTYNPALTVPSVSDMPPRESGAASGPRLKPSGESSETYADEASRDDRSWAASRVWPIQPAKVQPPQEWGLDSVPPKHTGNWGQQRRSSSSSSSSIRSNNGGVDTPVRSPGPVGGGGVTTATGPESQADSGKDVTDLASTPRERHRVGSLACDEGEEQRGRSRVVRGRGPAGTMGQDTTAAPDGGVSGVGSRSGLSGDREQATLGDHNSGLGSRLTQPVDLKGIGSAYDTPMPVALTMATATGTAHYDGKRRLGGEVVLDDDDDGLGLELDSRLALIALKTAPASTLDSSLL
ncbi:hypothetical protein MFIFM68171_09039 [Madurella fahalii]|uniref:Protein kinase domain-containing protein n=1 Tax=Madurella fahalii TaxID=1157608 RepID=A0ABQ0GM46_9PEZI